MSKSYPLNLSFKGNRDYIQGPDIIFELIDQIPDIKNDIKVQFHKMSSLPLKAFYVDNRMLTELKKSGDLCALLSYKSETNSLKLMAVIEDKSKVIFQRKEYNESQIIKGYEINDNEISQNMHYAGNFYERVVALYKELLNQTISKEFWIFLRLDLLSIDIKINSISIKIQHETGGEMYKANINGDGKFLGSIYFAKGAL